jgi:hypothetical protein
LAISGALPVELWDPSCGTYNELGSATSSSEEGGSSSIANYSPGTFHACFCQPFNCTDEILLQVPSTISLKLRAVDDEGDTLDILNFTTLSSTIKKVSFIPNNSGICGQDIQLQVLRASDNAVLFKSDCLDIAANHKDTVLIQYYNSPSRNFAGIDYADVTPDPVFSLRIPASFFHERFPQEMEVIELSNSRSIQLNTSLKKQKKLEVGLLPYYMHEKIILALQHAYVTINGVQYVKNEAYEMTDNNRRWPMKKASVWLTQKDYIIRNIL